MVLANATMTQALFNNGVKSNNVTAQIFWRPTARSPALVPGCGAADSAAAACSSASSTALVSSSTNNGTPSAK